MIPQRNETPAEHQWDLTPLFESDQRWETMFVEVETQLSSYQKYNGHLKESVAILKEAIDFHLGLPGRLKNFILMPTLKAMKINPISYIRAFTKEPSIC
jgi:oligoendopeptidase F